MLALLGLAFLLFLAGLEIDFVELRGRLLSLAAARLRRSRSRSPSAVGAAPSSAFGLGRTPLFVAIVLSPTSLGVIVPVLKDAGELELDVGQLIIAGRAIADFGAVLLLSFFFSGRAGRADRRCCSALFVGRSSSPLLRRCPGAGAPRASAATSSRLQDTTAEIRVRAAVVLLIAFVALAEALGLEMILGSFLAGALLALRRPGPAA